MKTSQDIIGKHMDQDELATTKKKIVVVSIYPPKNELHVDSGGVAAYTKSLVETMSKKSPNDDFIVITDMKNNMRQIWVKKNIKVIECFNRNPMYIFHVLKQIRFEKPDIIHVQQELGLYGNIITAFLLPVAIFLMPRIHKITTLHGVVSLKKIDRNFVDTNGSKMPINLVKAAFFIIFFLLCKVSDNIIVHEKPFKEILKQDYFVQNKKIFIIKHGIDDLAPIDRSEARKILSIKKQTNVILFMGYAAGYKGIDYLIEEYERYNAVNPNSLLILGVGPHPKLKNDSTYLREVYDRLKEKALSLGKKNVRWLGFISENEIPLYYSAADVSVYPYLYELSSSGPMAISIAYNLPYLASTVFRNTISEKAILFELKSNGLKNKLSDFFDKEQPNVDYVAKQKNERIWPKVADMTLDIYTGKN